MALITIHTATYNRSYILGKAYKSLCNQTCKDFEWIITDDGSTDNTEELVKGWQEQDNGFPIIYCKLPHVGIPRALNNGVNRSTTDWFMMLDSDDYILPQTVEIVLGWLATIKSNMSLAGVGFAKCLPNGDYTRPQKPIIDPGVGYVDVSHIDRYKYHLNMDMCEVHRTELFKRFPFQYWESERYAPEQLPFYEISLAGYKLRWYDEKLYVCDYLPDGQTKNNRLVKNNPMGFAMMYNQNLKCFKGFQRKCYNAIQMIALCTYAGHLGYLKKSNAPWVTVLVLPLGLIWGIRRKCQFARLK